MDIEAEVEDAMVEATDIQIQLLAMIMATILVRMVTQDGERLVSEFLTLFK